MIILFFPLRKKESQQGFQPLRALDTTDLTRLPDSQSLAQ